MTEDSPGAPSLRRDKSGTPDARESNGISTILGLDLGEFKGLACPQEPATSEVRSTTIHAGPAGLRNQPEAGSPGMVHFETCTVDGQVADFFAEPALPYPFVEPMHEAWGWCKAKRYTLGGGEVMPRAVLET